MSGERAPRDLGDGLRLRWATAADTERIAAFNGLVFRGASEDPPNLRTAAHTRAMMEGRIPVVGATDFLLVEDTRGSAIVASMVLMRQWWEYEGIRFSVGRPEFVGTDPDYRNRGLIRALFAELHAASAARGDLAQGITGIPYFYRQFGYEYALDLEGGRIAYPTTIPEAPAGEAERYVLRDATAGDLPFIMDLYDRRRAAFAVSTAVPEDFWHAAIERLDPDYSVPWRLRVIADAAGMAVGYLRTNSRRRTNVVVWDLAVRDGVPPRPVVLATLRALAALGPTLPPAGREPVPFKGILLALGRAHPVYDVIGEAVAPGRVGVYAWYVRVPDLPGFLRQIAPALDRRLGASPLAGYTGELRLDFYRDGLRLTFDGGRLIAAEPWRRPVWGEQAHASFPPLVFLQLLFGRRGLGELQEAFPDVLADDEAGALLNALFPKRLSWVTYLE